jgi:hypothetical protein
MIIARRRADRRLIVMMGSSCFIVEDKIVFLDRFIILFSGLSVKNL